MHRLLLLRHAKAAWPAPQTRDFDRPLTASGQEDALALGRRMKADGLVPEIVLCSPAHRTRETWEGIAESLDSGRIKVHFHDLLYNSDAAAHLATIRNAPDCRTLLVIGHNPMMEDLAYELPLSGETAALQAAGAGFPACGLAVINLPYGIDGVAPATGHLQAFLRPERR